VNHMVRRLVSGMVIGVMAVVLVVVGVVPFAAPAYAADNDGLVAAYKAELARLDHEMDRLVHMAARVPDVQAFIDAQRAKGRDVRNLQAALNSYKLQVAAVKPTLNTAKAILVKHAGFDGFKVTDEALARRTVKDAGDALQDAGRLLDQAARDLDNALREYHHRYK
jgi:hypothetical protein